MWYNLHNIHNLNITCNHAADSDASAGRARQTEPWRSRRSGVYGDASVRCNYDGITRYLTIYRHYNSNQVRMWGIGQPCSSEPGGDVGITSRTRWGCGWGCGAYINLGTHTHACNTWGRDQLHNPSNVRGRVANVTCCYPTFVHTKHMSHAVCHAVKHLTDVCCRWLTWSLIP